MEKNEKEILVRSQDGCQYIKFAFPLYVTSAEEWNENNEENRHGYVLVMFYTCIGEYEEKKHAVHVMNYLLAKRNYYIYDSQPDIKSVILNVPSDELVKQTADDDLLDGIPVKEEEKTDVNQS